MTRGIYMRSLSQTCANLAITSVTLITRPANLKPDLQPVRALMNSQPKRIRVARCFRSGKVKKLFHIISPQPPTGLGSVPEIQKRTLEAPGLSVFPSLTCDVSRLTFHVLR